MADDDFFEGQKNILKTWHDQDPANEDETNRTWAIAEYHGNKPNPFVLDETLIERAYFYDGFIMGDMNGDGLLNVLDIVSMVNVILSGDCPVEADMNIDTTCNVLDIVQLVNLVLNN